MRERPILFSAPMIRAILTGTKTQTRRPLAHQMPWAYHVEPLDPAKWGYEFPGADGRGDTFLFQDEPGPIKDMLFQPVACPFGAPGDRLWARETWYYEEHMHETTAGTPDLPGGRFSSRLIYRASYPDYAVNVGAGASGWSPSIHMPRWACRLVLENLRVCAERLLDITKEGARAEGFDSREAFLATYRLIYKLDDDADPWVWVVEFKRTEASA